MGNFFTAAFDKGESAAKGSWNEVKGDAMAFAGGANRVIGAPTIGTAKGALSGDKADLAKVALASAAVIPAIKATGLFREAGPATKLAGLISEAAGARSTVSPWIDATARLNRITRTPAGTGILGRGLAAGEDVAKASALRSKSVAAAHYADIVGQAGARPFVAAAKAAVQRGERGSLKLPGGSNPEEWSAEGLGRLSDAIKADAQRSAKLKALGGAMRTTAIRTKEDLSTMPIDQVKAASTAATSLKPSLDSGRTVDPMVKNLAKRELKQRAVAPNTAMMHPTQLTDRAVQGRSSGFEHMSRSGPPTLGAVTRGRHTVHPSRLPRN